MRPIDITRKLESARRDPAWTKELFRQLLEKVAAAMAGSSIDWDGQAGEEWGRVLLGGEVVVLLWLEGGFAFLNVSYADVLSQMLGSHSVQFEVVDDWEEARYKGDRASLLRLSGRGQLSETFDPAGFSANDLWWATV